MLCSFLPTWGSCERSMFSHTHMGGEEELPDPNFLSCLLSWGWTWGTYQISCCLLGMMQWQQASCSSCPTVAFNKLHFLSCVLLTAVPLLKGKCPFIKELTASLTISLLCSSSLLQAVPEQQCSKSQWQAVCYITGFKSWNQEQNETISV